MADNGETPSLGPDPDEQLARYIAAVRPFKAAQLLLNFRPGLFTVGIAQPGYRLPRDAVLQSSDDFGTGWKTLLRTDRTATSGKPPSLKAFSSTLGSPSTNKRGIVFPKRWATVKGTPR